MKAGNCFISSGRSNRTCEKPRGKLYWIYILLSQALAFCSRDEGSSMTLSGNGIALRSDLQPVGWWCRLRWPEKVPIPF